MTEKVSLFARMTVVNGRRTGGGVFGERGRGEGTKAPHAEKGVRKVGKMAKKLKIVN